MPHQLPRRSIGAALIVVLLHLAVLTSGFGCRFSMQGSTTMGTMEMGAVAGTQMGDSAQGPVLPAKSAPANAPAITPLEAGA